MALSDAEKTAVRRYCGYPVFGAQPTQGFGYRFFTWYGNLEYKMNNMQPSEEEVVRETYLANLSQLESDIVNTRDNLDTDKAAIWHRNKNEVADREQLLDNWRRRLCGFLGVPPGPGLGQGGIRMVI